MSSFVVTGGGGFIGSNIAEELANQGHQVTIVDDFSTGRRENIAHFVDRVRLVEGSVCDRATLDEAFGGADYVLHEAALPSVQRSVEAPLESNRINVVGTLNVLEAVRAAGVKRLVLAASSSAYGDQPSLPKVETMATQCLSPYAASKAACEQYCLAYYSSYGFETVCLRYFNIFGPRQDPKSQYSAVVPIFITKLLAGESPTVFGDGEQSRDFTYVANVVQANILAATAPNAVGQIINIACGDRYSLNHMLDELNRTVGANIKANYEPARAGDVKHSQADISKARELLGYEPSVSFGEGLERTVAWYREHM